jgi:hypothetical protein
VSSIRVLFRALGRASDKTWILKGTPRFFCPKEGVTQKKGQKDYV